MARFLVTGATRGIGRAVVDALADDELILVGRNSDALRELCLRLPNASSIVADLAVPGGLAQACARARLPEQLDGVVHAAALSRRGDLDEFTAEAWLELMAVNVVAVAELTRLVLPALRCGTGTVVLLNSGAGTSNPRPGGAAYSASKHALRAFADGLRTEEPGVRVTSVFLGRVATDMQRELQAYEGGAYKPHEYLSAAAVASFVAELLKLPKEVDLPEVTMRPHLAGTN